MGATSSQMVEQKNHKSLNEEWCQNRSKTWQQIAEKIYIKVRNVRSYVGIWTLIVLIDYGLSLGDTKWSPRAETTWALSTNQVFGVFFFVETIKPLNNSCCESLHFLNMINIPNELK